MIQALDASHIKAFLDEKPKTLIVSHYNPDGDAIGSSLALWHWLRALGIEATVATPNDFPNNLKWMIGADQIHIYKDEKSFNTLVASVSCIFCLDFQSLSRTALMADALHKAKAKKILIDHHVDPNTSEFDILFSDTKVSSTCEMVFRVFSSMGYESLITPDMAACIYAGIVTDTGSFSYSCSHHEIFEIVARLLDYGLDNFMVTRAINAAFSEDRLRLLGLCLSERLKVIPEHHTAYIYLTGEDLARFSYEPGDTEGIVNYALSIKDIRFAAFFIQRDNRIRISLRSSDAVDTNRIARDYFQGGGHRNASGGSSFKSMTDTIAFFETHLSEIMKVYAN